MNAAVLKPLTTLSRSEALFARAREVMPGGVSRNSVLRRPHPFYVSHGEGCYVVDIEGVRRIDFSNNMTSQIHGHAHPAIVEAVTQQLAKGTAFSLGTEAEVIFAEHMVARSPSLHCSRLNPYKPGGFSSSPSKPPRATAALTGWARRRRSWWPATSMRAVSARSRGRPASAPTISSTCRRMPC